MALVLILHVAVLDEIAMHAPAARADPTARAAGMRIQLWVAAPGHGSADRGGPVDPGDGSDSPRAATDGSANGRQRHPDSAAPGSAPRERLRYAVESGQGATRASALPATEPLWPRRGALTTAPRRPGLAPGPMPEAAAGVPRPGMTAAMPKQVDAAEAPNPVDAAEPPNPIDAAEAPKPVDAAQTPHLADATDAPKPTAAGQLPTPSEAAGVPNRNGRAGLRRPADAADIRPVPEAFATQREPLAAALAGAGGNAANALSDPIPVYPTAIPPSTALRYALRRGGERGSAVLLWQAGPDAYTLRLESTVGPGWARWQASAGRFDAAGLAPDRFMDARPPRAALAANFQREAGRITLSGSAQAFPLLAGSQDRLSWMIQLAAVMAADPARALPGTVTRLLVAGARGEPVVWAFRGVGPDADGLAANHPGQLVRLVREPESLWDSRVEVWLDPRRHHLPVRVRYAQGPQAQASELMLEELEPLR